MTSCFLLIGLVGGATIHGDEPWRSLVVEQIENRSGTTDHSNWEVDIRSSGAQALELRLKDPRRRRAEHTWELSQKEPGLEARMIVAYLMSVFQDDVKLHWVRERENLQVSEIEESVGGEIPKDTVKPFRLALGGGVVVGALGKVKARTQGLVSLGFRWNVWRWVSVYFDALFIPPTVFQNGTSIVSAWALPFHLGLGPRWQKGRWALDGGIALAFRTGVTEITTESRRIRIVEGEPGAVLRLGADYLIHERLELGLDMRAQFWFRRQSFRDAGEIIYDGEFAQITTQLLLGYRF